MTKLTMYSILALLLATSCKQDEGFENGGKIIHISTSINGVRSTSKTSFAKGDAISVYAYQSGEAQRIVVDNSINTFDGKLWSAEPKMVWGGESEKYDFLAVYPTRQITDFTATDFTLQSEIVKNDLLVATKTGVASHEAYDIMLNFSHIMSKVSINLTFNSSVTESKVERVVLKSLPRGRINFITKQVVANGAAADIELERVDNNQYVGITVPQTIAATTQMVEIYVEGDDNPYVYTTASAIDLNTNKHTTLNLTLGADNTIELKNTVINPWGESEGVEGDTGSHEDQIEPGPWEEGDDGTIHPDLAQNVTFDTQQYEIPDKSQMDFTNKILTISYRGGVAEISFSGKFDKELTVSIPNPKLTIVAADHEKYKNQRLIITATQPEEGKEYSVKLRVAHSLFPSTKFLDMTIKVMGNHIPSVVIGKVEWMAYNGCGRSRELYPPLEVNQTVRDVYRQKWHKYSANCMWGERIAPNKTLIYPWEVVRALNTEGTSIGSSVTSWPDNSTTIPCPNGWRVPTPNEINVFWPAHNTSAIGSYTKGGVTYKGSIVDSGAADIFVNATTTISPKIYVISFGNNELIFPLTGWRQRDDYAGEKSLPAINAGNACYLWTRAKGASGWTAYIAGVSADKMSFNEASGNREAFTEAYNGVRCVRSVK